MSRTAKSDPQAPVAGHPGDEVTSRQQRHRMTRRGDDGQRIHGVSSHQPRRLDTNITCHASHRVSEDRMVTRGEWRTSATVVRGGPTVMPFTPRPEETDR